MKNISLTFILFLIPFTSREQGSFTKITDSLNPIVGFINTGGYRGSAWIDVNNDGLVDLFAAPTHLFRNLGNGNFQSITTSISTGTPGNTGFASCSFADYNNDGNIDLFLVANKSRVYLNDGNGIFTVDSTLFTVSADYTGWAGCFGEANNDGRMDAVIAYAYGFLPGTVITPCIYFIQNSAGKLDTVKGYAFTSQLAPYTVPYWSDFDLDGDQDLFIASGPAGSPGADYCYRNLKIETGIDTLARITDLTFTTDLQDGQCYNFIDYDNDGDRDLCLTNYTGKPTRFYKNNNGIYQLLNMPFSNAVADLGNSWEDFDNDGDQDLILSSDFPGNVRYYRNDGNDVFTEVTFSFTSLQQGSSVSSGDYDNDGDEDIFIMSNVSAKGLYRNDGIGGTHHWVNITCMGSASNKSAIGTIVRLKCTINGTPTWQLREISAMNNFMGENDLRAHFGLGDATDIDSIEIKYLGGGKEVFTHVGIDAFYRQVEGSGSLEVLTGIHNPELNSAAIQLFPNPAQDMLTIRFGNGTQKTKLECIITNSAGQVMYSKKVQLTGDSIVLPIEELPVGYYNISFSGKNISYSAKFEKLRM